MALAVSSSLWKVFFFSPVRMILDGVKGLTAGSDSAGTFAAAAVPLGAAPINRKDNDTASNCSKSYLNTFTSKFNRAAAPFGAAPTHGRQCYSFKLR